MLLLMLFALIAGAGTAITPCVLPVVPALLSASAVGGRRRPLGIVLGLGLTFTIAIVALAQLVKGVGLASGAARTSVGTTNSRNTSSTWPRSASTPTTLRTATI